LKEGSVKAEARERKFDESKLTWCWPVEPCDRWEMEVPWVALRPLKLCRFMTPWKPLPILSMHDKRVY